MKMLFIIKKLRILILKGNRDIEM